MEPSQSSNGNYKRRREDEEEGEIVSPPSHQQLNDNNNNNHNNISSNGQLRYQDGPTSRQSRFHDGPPQYQSRFNDGPRFYDAPPPTRGFSDTIQYQKKGRWDNRPDNQMPPYERGFNRVYSNEWEGDRRSGNFPPPPSFQKVKSFGSEKGNFDRDYRERGPPTRDEYYDYRGPPQNQYYQGPPSYDDRGPYIERRSLSANDDNWGPRGKPYIGTFPRFRDPYPNDDRSFIPNRRLIDNNMREGLPPITFADPPRFNNFRLSRFSQPQFRRWGVGNGEFHGGRGGFGGRKPWGFPRDVAREGVQEDTLMREEKLNPPPTFNRIRSRFSKITDDNSVDKSTTSIPQRTVITDSEVNNILQLTEALMDYRLAFSLASLDLKPSTAISLTTKAEAEENQQNPNSDQHLSLLNPDKSPRHGTAPYSNRGTPHDSRTPHHDGRGIPPPYDSRSPYSTDGRPYDGRPYDNRTPHSHDGRFYDNRTPRINQSQTPTSSGYPYNNSNNNYNQRPPYHDHRNTPHQTPR